jgi:CelD/BcsL family acetyltransferase involved in cellulose biosynthesis
MLLAEVRHPSSLTEQEKLAWRAFCAAEPAFAGPLLGPDFAQLVGQVREDARVASLQRDGRLVGFLAFHRRPAGPALPIGSAFSDYQALIAAPGERIDASEALAAAGISGLRLTALLDPRGAFEGMRPSEHEGHVIALQGSAGSHEAWLKAANPKRFKNWMRLKNKLERELGALTLTAADHDPEALDQLIAWKREQYVLTGAHDVLRPSWARALYHGALERRAGPLRGVLTTLRAGGRLVAGHFGVAGNGVFHAWLSSMDRACTSCAPGQVLTFMMPWAMEELGLNTLDLGPGYAHYKAPFATAQVPVQEGLAIADGRAGRSVRSLDRAWAIAGEHKIKAVARLRNRLNHIAAAETSMGGQVRGLVEAFAGYGRRSATREPPVAAAVAEEA